MIDEFIAFARMLRGVTDDESVPLSEPCFTGDEKDYVINALDSTYVSTVGTYVDQLEAEVATFTGARHAIATVNGTAALHTALLLVGVGPNEEVITQALTFVATCNAIRYCGADPVFIDVERDTLGLCPHKLRAWLTANAQVVDGRCINRTSQRRIAACLPVHTLGHPANVKQLHAVCEEFSLPLVEDAAAALGSYRAHEHVGAVSQLAILSFNGNKVITTGGGGMLLTNDDNFARRARHITTTAKRTHAWLCQHDELGFNYRMPNLNAALGCAQLKNLPRILTIKRQWAERYRAFFEAFDVSFVNEPITCRSNYWLNAISFPSKRQRDSFLDETNRAGVVTRPLWDLMNTLPMFSASACDQLKISQQLADSVVCIPSSPIITEVPE